MIAADKAACVCGFFDAIVCAVQIDREVLSPCFPPGLEPADAGNPRPTILLMFGQQTHVRPWFMKDGGSSYLEWVAAVPSVRRTDAPDTPELALVSRLYLDHWFWVVMGWLYGFPKVRARIRREPAAYGIRALLSGRPITDLSVRALGPLVSVPSSPDAPLIRPYFELPFIGQVIPGLWIYSRMWFLLDQAYMAPVAATFTMQPDCVPNLPALSFDVHGITPDRGRAFHLRVPWKLSRPYLSPGVPPNVAKTP
jgi:hypothetical protein